jgi:hypothetical protein
VGNWLFCGFALLQPDAAANASSRSVPKGQRCMRSGSANSTGVPATPKPIERNSWQRSQGFVSSSVEERICQLEAPTAPSASPDPMLSNRGLAEYGVLSAPSEIAAFPASRGALTSICIRTLPGSSPISGGECNQSRYLVSGEPSRFLRKEKPHASIPWLNPRDDIDVKRR